MGAARDTVDGGGETQGNQLPVNRRTLRLLTARHMRILQDPPDLHSVLTQWRVTCRKRVYFQRGREKQQGHMLVAVVVLVVVRVSE
jgi:hypothetical protein